MERLAGGQMDKQAFFENRACRSCLFWLRNQAVFGWCRRRAPQPYLRTGRADADVWLWPQTAETQWCGEWEAGPEGQK